MKTFVIKLTIFIFLILILQKFVLSYFPYQPPQAVESLKTYQQNETNIIFFGDSTTTW